MKRGTRKSLAATFCALAWLAATSWAQVNSGSDGSDGAFNPTNHVTINMADHPTGIYQYTAVNIPAGVTVTFIPNPNNTPVVWLVQTSCVISGTVDVSGAYTTDGTGGTGGPGGYRGGNGGTVGSNGQGPGGGQTGMSCSTSAIGTGGSYGSGNLIYGNQFIIPLLGGSGGAGVTGYSVGGGGGGGAMLIAASGQISLVGFLLANGADASWIQYSAVGGGGSGGGVRLNASKILGTVAIRSNGGMPGFGCSISGEAGRVRFDSLDINFGGTINGVFTQGFQPIIIPTAGQGAQLTIASVAGVPVSASPTGQIATPDAVVAAQQANPVAVVVQCQNIPLNTLITVTVKPATGAAVSAVGYNTTGTTNASTATVLINMPRGGGLIYATAATAP